MSYSPQQRYNPGAKGERDENPRIILDTSKIDLKNLSVDLFDTVAKDAAMTIADSKKDINKPTQLRRFYDEIVLWESKANQHPDRLPEYLPFIRMINAKVAYASGRKLVDDNFVKLLNHCLSQVDSVDSLRHCKLFMEAFMGFYKEKRPKD